MEISNQITSNDVVDKDILSLNVLAGAERVVNSTVVISSGITIEFPSKTRDNESNIVNVFWVRDTNFDSPTTVLLYKSDDLAYLYVNLEPSALDCNLIIEVKYRNLNGDIETLKKIISKITSTEGTFPVEINRKSFSNKKSGKILKLYVRLFINNKFQGEFCNNEKELLNVSIVRYIPAIMRNNGFETGFKLQKQWFNTSANSNAAKRANLDIVNFEYFLKFKRFQDKINSILLEKSWLTLNAKDRIKNVINNELINKNLQLPDAIPKATNFGLFSSKLILNEDQELVPEYDANYVQFSNYEEILLESPIDDMYASLGSLNLHIGVSGYLAYLSPNTCTVIINKININIQDPFDFEYRGLLKEPLGTWSPLTNKVYKFDIFEDSFYFIVNGDYRQYREMSGMGGDFNVFSKIKTYDTNDSFESDIVYNQIYRRNILKI